jgi:hypothetical protein
MSVKPVACAYELLNRLRLEPGQAVELNPLGGRHMASGPGIRARSPVEWVVGREGQIDALVALER